MNKGQKVALRHAANAIDGTRPATGHIQLGARAGAPAVLNTVDHRSRPFASVYLARRAGYTPLSQVGAQSLIVDIFGLTAAQAAKVDRVAASTHNLKQRAQRVARFLRRVVVEPTYVGSTRQPTTGAVASTL